MDIYRGSLSHYRLQLVIPALFGASPWSGRLRLERGPTVRCFYLHSGRLTGESSTLASEHLTQVLANLGILNATRAAEAFAEAEQANIGLGQLLLQSKEVDERQLREALEYKARESFFDCYEWESGDFEFQPGDSPQDRGVPLTLSLSELHQAALERRREWRAFWEIFRAPDTTLDVFAEQADPAAGSDELELVTAASRGLSVGELLSRAQEGRLFSARRVTRLYHRGALLPRTGSGQREQNVADAIQLLSLAQSRFASGDYEGAAAIASKVLERAPVPEAHTLFRESESRATQAISQEVAGWEDRLKVRNLCQPVPAGVTSDELYLHARLRSGQPVREVMRTAPMGELAAFRAIRRLHLAGAVDLEGDETGSRALLFGATN